MVGFRDEILGLLEGRLAATTIRLYGDALKSFLRIVGDRPLSSLTPYHVERFLTQRLNEVSAAKVNIDYSCLKAAFARAVTYRMIPQSPFEGIKRVPIPEQQPRFLSRQEFERLFRVIHDPTTRSIVVLAVCTAMRLGELVNLRWQDVDLNAGLIQLNNRKDFRTKGRRNRVVPLNQRAKAVIMGLPRISEYLFVGKSRNRLLERSVSRRFKKCVRAAGLPEEIHFHSLRHTGATWLVQSNVPISYVKEILGHSSVTTTMIYAHSTTDHLRESMLRIDPFFEN
jgi:integrase